MAVRGNPVVNCVAVEAGLQVQLRGATVTKTGPYRVDVLAKEACVIGAIDDILCPWPRYNAGGFRQLAGECASTTPHHSAVAQDFRILFIQLLLVKLQSMTKSNF